MKSVHPNKCHRLTISNPMDRYKADSSKSSLPIIPGLAIYCFYILCMLGFGTLYAHEINGTIVDVNNKPLEGVGVYNKTTSGYTYSNIAGYFELDGIAAGDILYFYSLGYENRQLVINESQLNGSVRVVLNESALSLEQVVLVSKVNALSNFVTMDFKTNPVKSSQEILRKIPGLVIGQHAGGGKAEQIFLRGFDIDHGTDIAISLDGIPVNLVSHAHGQGYADMHFIIPETLDNIDFGKGPYYASKGNFTTAGYITLKTKETLENNLISLEAGQFNTLRGLALLKLVEGGQSNAYMASEFNLSNGPFESPQNFNRLNLMGRYTFNNYINEKFNVTLSHFSSKWDASGQIPQRAVDQGAISRFGAIDDTEGGNTSRSNFYVNHSRELDEHRRVQSVAYLSHYDFELFSNFTFFLEDPVNGDQIRQKEDRTIMGMESKLERSFHMKDHDAQLKYEAGIGFRYDKIREVQLSRTKNRKELLERLAYGNTDELNTNLFAEVTYKLGKWSVIPGLRVDYFKFDYEDLLSETYSNQAEDKFFISPKFNLVYAASQGMQLYLKTGQGFHSNDTRVVVSNTGERTLPAALGADLGAIVKPTDRLVVNAALWTLHLQQEFVYVGDAAIVEPSGRSKRYGADLGLQYQLGNSIYVNGDVNYVHARSTDEPKGMDYIPLAPALTASGGINFRDLGPFNGGVSFRYLQDRPANEDNSIIAKGYLVSDLNLNYSYQNVTIGILVENLFDTAWNETQFATESRLFNETQPTEEIHFTPGTPFYIRGKISIAF